MKKLRYFIETSSVEFLAWSMRRLPRHVILVLARIIGTLAWIADFRGRTTAVENLRVTFGELFTWSARQRIARHCYQNFARTFFDLFWVGSLSKASWQDHFVIEALDPVALEATRTKGAVWVTPHFGNFELSSIVWGFAGFRHTIVAQDFKNPALTDIFTAARQSSGHTVIPQQSAMLRLTKALSRGSNAGFLTDLNVKPGRAAAVIECFGLKTCVTTLHVMLAQRLGLTILPALCFPLEDGRYRVKVFHPIKPGPDESPQVIAQQCWDIFEKEIRARPELWMWMYKHWRYLPDETAADRYPDYANLNKAFANMLKEERPMPSAKG